MSLTNPKGFIARRALEMRRKPPPVPTMQDAHLPVPSGGLNTIQAGGEMPPRDAISLFNLVQSELGMRVRNGYAEWVTGITGLSGNEIRTIIPYNGTTVASNDKLFACTDTGIWDCSASTQTPTQMIVFPNQTSRAGYGIYYTLTNSAGNFLMYCDEDNGYYVYVQNGAFWAKAYQQDGVTAWASGQAVVVGNLRTSNSNLYIATSAGNTGASAPVGIVQSFNDGAVTWQWVPGVLGVDPAQFVFVMYWKAHTIFAQKNTQNAWYLTTAGGAFQGQAIVFPVAAQSKHGGFLVGLWNWSLSGDVAGLNNFLVLIFSSGDIAIYQGDTIASVGFRLYGVWWVGGVVAGRKIATEFGGDIVILGAQGAIPLSKIMLGIVATDRSQYLTSKITTLFNTYFQLYGSNIGWSIDLDTTNNTLMINVPAFPGQGQPSLQLAMSISQRSWSVFPDLPMWSGVTWNGTYYIGTNDGRVVRFTGFVDNITLANPAGTGNNINYSLLTSFQNLGSGKKKQVHFIRPIITSDGVPNYQAVARYDYDISAQGALGAPVLAGGSLWDVALWDSGIWGGDYNESQQISDAAGIGAHVAIGLRGSSNGKTIVVGFDVSYDVLGFM